MLAGELAALASTSAATLVAAMTTDAWAGIRSGVARIFGHDGEAQRHAAESQLDRNADLVAQADDKDHARQSLVGVWTLELEGLLSRHPGAAVDLQALMNHARASLPQAQQSWVMTVISNGGLSVGVQKGNVIMHGTNWQPGTAPATDAAGQPEGQP
jgi:hypothetical protein